MQGDFMRIVISLVFILYFSTSTRFVGAVDYLYCSGGNSEIGRFDLSSCLTFAITGSRATIASGLSGPRGLSFNLSGDLYAVNYSDNSLTVINQSGYISNLQVGLTGPRGLAFDSSGKLYVGNQSGTNGNTISRLVPNSDASYFCAGVYTPEGLAFDSGGYLYVANEAANSISKVNSLGNVSQFAVGLANPTGIAFDVSGNLFVTSYLNNTISKVNANGTVSLFASGFYNPIGLAFDSLGNLYIANSGNNTISKLDSNGQVLFSFSTGPLFPSYIIINSISIPEPSSYILAIFAAFSLCVYSRSIPIKHQTKIDRLNIGMGLAISRKNGGIRL